jgi:NADPH:quinone reductase-like Zn-dependent oxidoreductase
MQRVRLTGYGEPPDVFDLEALSGEPEPGPGEVFVAMEAAASIRQTSVWLAVPMASDQFCRFRWAPTVSVESAVPGSV